MKYGSLGLAFFFAIGGLTASAASDTVHEATRETPILAEADVVVIGGGLSGVGAALGAARTGAKTLVIERTGYLGGWLRGTGMGNVLAVNGWRPSLGEGVLRDITARMVELKADRYPSIDAVVKRGHLLVTNHEDLPQAFESLATEAGAEILYFSTYVDSIVENGKITTAIVETPVGRGAIRGKVFIDCTGLATVAAESGAPVKKAEAFMGLACWIGGVDEGRYRAWLKTRPQEGSPELRKWLEGKLGEPITYFSSDGGGPDMNDYPWDDWWSRNSGIYGEFFRQAVDNGEMPLYYPVGKKGKLSIIEGLKTEQFELFGGVSRPRTYIVGVDPTDMRQVSEAHIKSKKLIFAYVAFLNKYVPGFEKAHVLRIADMTIPRAGRSIDGQMKAPSSDEIGRDVEHDDAICVLQRGKERGSYEVPYRAMLPQKITNLLAVGKSSVGGIRFRTHMLSIIMGQAAGTAAAIAVADGVAVGDVDIRKLQANLRATGIGIP